MQMNVYTFTYLTTSANKLLSTKNLSTKNSTHNINYRLSRDYNRVSNNY